MARNMPNANPNMIPLGSVQKAPNPAAPGISLLLPSYLTAAVKQEGSSDKKRGAPERETDSSDREERKKKRKSRWEAATEKVMIPGMPTQIPQGLNKEQEEAYLLQLKIEETSRRLRSGDLGIPAPEDRSPSPEPIYSSDGKRLNTREYRKRKQLEEERHEAVQRMILVNPDYKPPADYRAIQVRVSDKVLIPQDNHPEINFIGLIIGPRGNTLKSLEKETGAKIIIRGKGSVKEGKVGTRNGQPLPGEDEPLHAYITALDPDCVKRAVNKIKQVIQEGVELPESNNELRKNQLRELALLNGTLRDDGTVVRCTNCGADNHRSWQCQDKAIVTNTIRCNNCGGMGHIAADCRERGQSGSGGSGGGGGRGADSKIDLEYMSLMAELGEGPPPPAPSGGNNRDWGSQGGGGRSFHGPPPPGPPPQGRLGLGFDGGPPSRHNNDGGGWSNNRPPHHHDGRGGGFNDRNNSGRPPFGGPPPPHHNMGGGMGDGGFNRGPPPPFGPPGWAGGGPQQQRGPPPPGFGGPPPHPSMQGGGNQPPGSRWGQQQPMPQNRPPPSWQHPPAPVPPPPGRGPVPPPPGVWGGGWSGGPSTQQNMIHGILGAPPPPPPPPPC